ncbi:hypothetical protein O6H91_23G012300 [Diphasiastrum complanatum]|uniref:Uncharacterized protein n=11 Tax=Diphasiastrum complanatum TaxID=34168 RepID=A0ACC2A874_DIPCM|nr:hypothetical protein O6H91_23G012300 [Diphasiastrum complanatum]KAJ7513729.1 hypothetical protein O6H91_23G012300 [Diphasiastrum complanatum]KAJ7513730.1 hypothetical protein O6H91_23G012300 [Diphasiastrum complanatum]KAJ7513731.1 hypothetical protein O6H91_23G012300 [Diphasiastrum complanatum]KAJ7513732.1 hypothetical protein O6H91_23G012300 [Diphasiastrum complanatum]
MGALPEAFYLDYPESRRDDSVVEDYHGVSIPDPYRWLEDPDTKEVKEFVETQRNLTDSVLNTCEGREKLKEKITALFDYAKYECPFRHGDKYFYFYNSGLQPQSVLYVQDSLEGKAKVLLDPNQLSEDGTVALHACSFNENAKYLAFGISTSGSDWITIKVLRVDDQVMEPDTLSWVKFSTISWTHDNKGFFYCRYPAPMREENKDAGTETNQNLHHQLYYHFLGSNQSEDILCWKDPEHPKWMFGAQITEDGKYLVMSIEEGCDPVNKLYFFDLSTLKNGLEGLRESKELLPFQKLIDNFEAQYQLIANDGSIFTFLSNKNASRYKVIRVDILNPHVWTDVIPESEKNVLRSVHCVNGHQLVVCYLSDVKYVLQIHELESGSLIQQLPLDIGTISMVSGKRKNKEVFFSFTSFLTPGIIYRCDLNQEKLKLDVFRETIVNGFDRTAFETRQVFVRSKDSSEIPMFIVSKKGIILHGNHPALLYGYGGFSISITPGFSISKIILVGHFGAVYATANIRGGGEYGEEWHKAGSLANKQNCFDDFQACAEFLIREKYTSPNKLGIEGGSNGGLLVAACINQRPELFGCALAHVGVMDMLRFHKFTIGHAWTSEYGCSDQEEQFHWLIKYSPLHNVARPWNSPDGKEGYQYPATMLLTADHDDRVVPLHSLKLLATMQYILGTSLLNSPQINPIIARIETKAGHGCGRPTQKIIEEAADKYAFLAKMIGATWTD